MYVPLIVLAFLSVVGGVLSWPHVLGGHDWLVGWLTPVVGSSPGPAGDHVVLEFMLMGAAVGAGVIGLVLAYVLYAKRIHPLTAQLASQGVMGWLYQRVLHKWHVDEYYDAVVVKPLMWKSEKVLYNIVDRRIIDGAVNFVGWFTRSVGFLAQPFHGGNIQKYLAVFLLALALLIYYWFVPVGSSVEEQAMQHTKSKPAAAYMLGVDGGAK